MKRNIAVPIILLTSGIVFGGGATLLAHLATSTNNASDMVDVAVEQHTNGGAQVMGSKVNDDRDRITKSKNLSSVAIEDASLRNNPFQLKLTAYSYVASLSELQVVNELKLTLEPEPERSVRVLKEFQTALLERLAVLNPVVAMQLSMEMKSLGTELETLNPLDTREYSPSVTDYEFMPFVRSVFNEWALSDLDDAVNNAKALTEDARMNALAGILATLSGEPLAVFRTIAKEVGDEELGTDSYVMSFSTATVDDPKAIWDELLSLVKQNDTNKSKVLENIAQQWYEKDGMRVLDDINTSPLDEYIKENVVDRVLRLAAANTPHEAFQYAQTLSKEGSFSSVLYSVIDVWAQSDPQSAYQAASSVEPSGQREQLQREVVVIWSSNEPYEFLENLDSFPPHTHETGISNAIESIAQTSPQEAAEIALEQDAGPMESFYFIFTYSVMPHWVEQDVEAAIDWVFTGPVPEEERHTWVRALTTNLVYSDPRRAFDLALKQPKSEGGMEAFLPAIESQIIEQIVFTDLDLAVELLPKVPEGKSRFESYSSVGRKYIDLGESEKAVTLGLKLPPDDQVGYFQRIAFIWARIDPTGLVESLKNLPTTELRSSVAQYVTRGSLEENFTDTQLDALKQHIDE